MIPLCPQYISSQKTEQLMSSSFYISNVSEDLVIFYCYYQLMFKNVTGSFWKVSYNCKILSNILQ